MAKTMPDGKQATIDVDALIDQPTFIGNVSFVSMTGQTTNLVEWPDGGYSISIGFFRRHLPQSRGAAVYMSIEETEATIGLLQGSIIELKARLVGQHVEELNPEQKH